MTGAEMAAFRRLAAADAAYLQRVRRERAAAPVPPSRCRRSACRARASFAAGWPVSGSTGTPDRPPGSQMLGRLFLSR